MPLLDIDNLVKSRLMASDRFDLQVHTLLVAIRHNEKTVCQMLCDWEEMKSMSMMATSEPLIKQIQSSNVLEENRVKVAMYTTQHILSNETKAIKDCYAQSVL